MIIATTFMFINNYNATTYISQLLFEFIIGYINYSIETFIYDFDLKNPKNKIIEFKNE